MSDISALKDAYTLLAKEGIVGYHNFWCCGGCAAGGVANNYDALPEAERSKLAGAVYYHEQGAEFAIGGAGLILNYGSFPHESHTDESVKAVGEKIVAALRAAGLDPVWNGDPSDCIEIPRFTVTLHEIPYGEGSSLHSRDDEDDEDDGW
jgi:hypothetical protein